MLRAAGVAPEAITITRSAELRYAGQGHQVTVGVPLGPIGDDVRCVLADRFEQEYRRLYGRTASGNPVEAVNWRVVASAPSPSFSLTLGQPASRTRRSDVAQKGRRPVYLPETRGFELVPVYDRYALVPGMSFAGPAIVEERESTAVIGPGASVSVDEWMNLIIQMPR